MTFITPLLVHFQFRSMTVSGLAEAAGVDKIKKIGSSDMFKVWSVNILVKGGGGSSVCWGQGSEAKGSWFKSQCGQTMEGSWPNQNMHNKAKRGCPRAQPPPT